MSRGIRCLIMEGLCNNYASVVFYYLIRYVQLAKCGPHIGAVLWRSLSSPEPKLACWIGYLSKTKFWQSIYNYAVQDCSTAESEWLINTINFKKPFTSLNSSSTCLYSHNNCSTHMHILILCVLIIYILHILYILYILYTIYTI